jgi:hypothetical protein
MRYGRSPPPTRGYGCLILAMWSMGGASGACFPLFPNFGESGLQTPTVERPHQVGRCLRAFLKEGRKAPERNPAVKLAGSVNQRAREFERVPLGGPRGTVTVALGPRDSASEPRARLREAGGQKRPQLREIDATRPAAGSSPEP